jgi:hypothetical protein
MRAIELIEADSCDQLGGKIAQAVVLPVAAEDVLDQTFPISGPASILAGNGTIGFCRCATRW